ncbi:hypothetical protein C5L23_001275 [Leuconostoc fallax]|uniref:Major facilitator superfamily (MFS) profile domain-containing protein n=1 Tax=Leuconostoc fallax TaxID=1251 RepID=A0A4R5N7R6_9LACO|nr:hypothetical protein C5L23_001275 [Leuconostoc fallax]
MYEYNISVGDLGVLIWGMLSDRYGRKPSMLIGIFLGINIALPVILKSSLYAYTDVIVLASGIFGLMYYCLISMLTFIMSLLHNGRILVFPLYTVTLILIFLILLLINKNIYRQAD